MNQKLFILLLFGLLAALVQAQSQDVQRKVEAIETTASEPAYTSEAAYWQQVVNTNLQNEDAWLNLYKATRYSSYTDHSRSINTNTQTELNDILARMNNAVPNSFAYNYSSYLHANRSDESFEYLKRANTLRPDDIELWDDMVCKSTIEGNNADVKKWSTQLNNASIYNAAQMEYNRNVLNSVEQNGILVTNGNVDTYPIVILQQVFGVRTDVRIICLDWYGSKKYVESITTLTGVKAAKNKVGDAYNSLTAILAENKSSNIYLALTLPPDVLKKEARNLYCTGLAMKFSKAELQNLESLRYNWENLFQKNYLAGSDEINRNYLVPLLQLRDYYTTIGDTTNADALKNLATQCATVQGLSEQLKTKLD
ncbi:MAG: hypothetical protein ACKVOR_01845 [Flavobacteriales bacterium]